MQGTQCPNNDHPDGWELGSDEVHWGIVIQAGLDVSNYEVRLISNGAVTRYTLPDSGLRYGSASISPGTQRLEIWNGGSNPAYVAQGGRCVSSGCPDGIFNMNQIVVGLVPFTSGMNLDLCQCGPSGSESSDGSTYSCATCRSFDLVGDAKVCARTIIISCRSEVVYTGHHGSYDG